MFFGPGKREHRSGSMGTSVSKRVKIQNGNGSEKRSIGSRDRLLVLSSLGILVGIAGGLVAVGMLRTINFITDLLYWHRFSSAYLPPNQAPFHWWLLLLPALGGLLVGLLVNYFSPEIKGDGIPEAMAVVLTNRSIVKPRVGFFKPLSAAVTVGTGGPFGAEGPIIQTGAALGSILSQFIPSSPSERRTLLACVAGAGLACVMTKALYLCEDFFEELKIWFPLIPAIGGLGVGAIAYFYPQVLGTGYAVIADLLSKPHSVGQFVGIGVAKLGAFAIALGSGASGGTFAPALMIGGSLGAAFGKMVHLVVPNASTVGLYGMVATAALFGSVYRATPSAILFMLEVTGAYNAFLPVFLVAIIADLAVHYFMRTTINTERLVRRGTLVPEAYTVDPMKMLRVRDVMTPDVDTVRASAKVSEFLTDVMAHGSVPVVDDHDHFLGMLRRSDLIAASPMATAESMLHKDFPLVYADDVVHDIALRFVQEGIGRCPVLDRESSELVGILTAFDLLKAKDWEQMQEMPEPGRLWGLALARFGVQDKEGNLGQ